MHGLTSVVDLAPKFIPGDCDGLVGIGIRCEPELKPGKYVKWRRCLVQPSHLMEAMA